MMTRENVAEESSDYLACQTWVALVHLHIPVIENQLDNNSNEQSYIAILAHSQLATARKQNGVSKLILPLVFP